MWTEWGSCDKSCGLGKAMRQRWCTNPRPMYGGLQCPGEHVQFRACNDFPCIGKIEEKLDFIEIDFNRKFIVKEEGMSLSELKNFFSLLSL